MKQTFSAVWIAALVLLLAAGVGLANALPQAPGPGATPAAPAAVSDGMLNYIPVQGKLTDASGRPLTGTYNLTFRLYDVISGGAALHSDTHSVKVVNGLFNSEIGGVTSSHITGQQLYVGIEVESDGEMDPRLPVFAVPYAWSLKPNASVIGTVSSGAVLHIENAGVGGRALRAYAMADTGTNYGIVGAAVSPDGYGGYFYNNSASGGTGLWASSTNGVGLKAGGATAVLAESASGVALQANSASGVAVKANGKIQSSASSTVWISGNGVRPYKQADQTTIDMTDKGGARVTRGAASGNRNVMLPITIPAQLYGQNVTVTDLDIVYLSNTAFDGITAVLLRRQTGMCTDCYLDLKADGADHVCDDSATPNGCTLHYDLTSNNQLSPTSGVLYLTLELAFSGEGSWVEIGGVSLTLSHQ